MRIVCCREVLAAVCVAAILSAGSVSVGVAADDKPSYTGQWKNFKYGTSGPLTCTFLEQDGEKWKAEFTGKFKGEPFRYPATFSANEQDGGMAFKGETILDGDKYEWYGGLKDGKIAGRFKSLKGYYGEFHLKKDD
ncbi:hypothetical protein [Stratiformator vulcanicus]|uniref:MORN repeat protein n=1 Tax=Stratiformator vulcanicus TaxID=2527980 RepID=A0A517QWC1_9PLAN|nr:hypothetical protein [Stratiformator vulcanicus]QDT35887.1 hypothetical protein Pan189_02400 [Stratiformator vulcanicus]